MAYTKEEIAALSAGFDAEELGRSIGLIAQAMEKLAGTRLQQKTIVLLVAHSSGVSQRDVKKVLESLGDLQKDYLKPAKKDA